MSALGLDEFLSFAIPVCTEVIADDDVTGPQSGTEEVTNVFSEDLGVGRSVDNHAGGLPTQTNRAEHGGGVPVTTGSMVMESLSVEGTPSQSSHIGLGAGFIQEDQSFNGQLLLGFFPESPFLKNVRSILLAGP